ncbi:MAG: selenide, water dikinase SelD [Actinomycetota bacterium]
MRTDAIRLTEFSHGAGCACKIGPDTLREVLGTLGPPAAAPPELIVSNDTGDDAAVYSLGDGRALIATTDFFTPIVDDPGDWGRIAATNALSDVYAMGGTPALALNLVGWPVDELPVEMLGEVLRGGQDVARAAGAVVVGGHSITDPEPKYGMAVVGFVEETRLLRNSTAPAGATLFLTKPLGTGMISTAIKRRKATEEQIAAAVETMTTLNDRAARAALAGGAAACTDVTGFGLLGHLRGMLAASRMAATVDASAPELLPDVLDLARTGVVAGGSQRNHSSLAPDVEWGALTLPEQLVLADAQTSGGLLIAAPEAERMAGALAAEGIAARRIGVTRDGTPGSITVDGRVG